MNFLIKRFLSIDFLVGRVERREVKMERMVPEENFEHKLVSSFPEWPGSLKSLF